MVPDLLTDPEADATATYAVDPGYARRLTARVVCAPRPGTTLTHTPMTGAPLAWLPQSSPADVTVAFSAARAAQRSWARMPIEHRARVFLRFHDLVLARQEPLLDLIQLESGKARVHAFEEVADTAIRGTCDLAAGKGPFRCSARRSSCATPRVWWGSSAPGTTRCRCR